MHTKKPKIRIRLRVRVLAGRGGDTRDRRVRVRLGGSSTSRRGPIHSGRVSQQEVVTRRWMREEDESIGRITEELEQELSRLRSAPTLRERLAGWLASMGRGRL